MTAAPVPLVAGNWKMNGLRSSLDEIQAVRAAIGSAIDRVDVVICPPATLLMAAAEVCRGSSLRLGGQDCHTESNGAHTGDLSAEMLADAGASYVILGHSERRADHCETSGSVKNKALAALRGGLIPIICVGETGAERETGRALEVVGSQLKASIPADLISGLAFVIAYEPVWAIGTGVIPTPEDIANMHAFIRRELVKLHPGQGQVLKILYGGSVKPDNARDIALVENVNGVLVGGASLKSADFIQIMKAF
jgi:triosephosphate isomerase